MSDCTCKHLGYCDGSCTHLRPTLEELRITDLRATLFTIIDLDHHWQGNSSRATAIARAAILRDNDLESDTQARPQAKPFLPTEDGEFNGNVITPDPLMTALRALNEAAYAVIRAAGDTTKYPMFNRQMLRQIVTMTDALMEAGTERTAELEGE